MIRAIRFQKMHVQKAQYPNHADFRSSLPQKIRGQLLMLHSPNQRTVRLPIPRRRAFFRFQRTLSQESKRIRFLFAKRKSLVV